jgi:Resolvase, N terminal domain/Amidohydrolase family
MIAAIYARKSTEQIGVSDETRSVTRQIEQAKAYAAHKGWTVPDAHVFVDDGISGAEFARRPGVQRLRAALKPRPSFQVLIVSEQSRLSRDTADTLQVLKELARAGVRVFAYQDDRAISLETPADTLVTTVNAWKDSEARREAGAIPVTDWVQMITTHPARALAVDHLIGRLQTGKADITVVWQRGSRPWKQPSRESPGGRGNGLDRRDAAVRHGQSSKRCDRMSARA